MPQPFVDTAAVEADISRVHLLSGAALRRRWQAVFARSIPQHLTADLLRRMIANRIQEEADWHSRPCHTQSPGRPCPARALPPGRAQSQDRDRAGPRLPEPAPHCDGRTRGLCLGSTTLFQPVGDRAGDHRHGLEQPALLRPELRRRAARSRCGPVSEASGQLAPVIRRQARLAPPKPIDQEYPPCHRVLTGKAI